jgi:hypothetical protein
MHVTRKLSLQNLIFFLPKKTFFLLRPLEGCCFLRKEEKRKKRRDSRKKKDGKSAKKTGRRCGPTLDMG